MRTTAHDPESCERDDEVTFLRALGNVCCFVAGATFILWQVFGGRRNK